MKKTIGDRLSLLVSNLGIQKQEFAYKIRFSTGYVSLVLNGSKPAPSGRFIEAVCREFNVNPEWIIKGKGEMFTVPGLLAPSSNTEVLIKYNLLPKQRQLLIDEIINSFLRENMAIEEEKDKKKGKN